MSYFDKFMDIIRTLRGPDGCPWDKEQTAESLRSDLLEEAYECIDAINGGDDSHMNEELGDLFLLVSLISYIKEQEGSFSVESVMENIGEKLIRRHPHVFGDSNVKETAAVLKQWDTIKTEVEGRRDEKSVLNTIPKSLPPLERSFRLQKKAAKVGFDWKDRIQVWDKLHEEIDELKELGESPERSMLEEECGDLLFTAVNLCRHYGIDPAIALHGTNGKFVRRFQYVEEEMKRQGKNVSVEEFERMDDLWEKSKLGEE